MYGKFGIEESSHWMLYLLSPFSCSSAKSPIDWFIWNDCSLNVLCESDDLLLYWDPSLSYSAFKLKRSKDLKSEVPARLVLTVFLRTVKSASPKRRLGRLPLPPLTLMAPASLYLRISGVILFTQSLKRPTRIKRPSRTAEKIRARIPLNLLSDAYGAHTKFWLQFRVKH